MLVCERSVQVKKVIPSVITLGFVGLICGSAGGQTAENIIKLKKSDNWKGYFLGRANLEGVNLGKANLKGTNREFDDKNFYRLSVARLIQQRTKSKVQKTKKR